MKKRISLLFIFISLPIFSQWIEQNSGVTTNLTDVYCVTENIVLIVGNDGTILKTTDGGLNWIQKNSGTTTNLSKIKFVNTTIGYAVGNNGTVLKTINQGENWTILNSGTTNNLYGLSCLSENIFFISGENGLIKKSINGGISFTEQNITTTQSVIDIQFINEQTGYTLVGISALFSGEKLLYKTTNGGISWQNIVLENVNAFYFINENVGFVKKYLDGFYKTIDGGTTFQILNSGSGNIFDTEIFALNENTVWELGYSPALCNCSSYCITKREDLQNTTTQVTDFCKTSFSAIDTFEAIHFANENLGFVVGSYGMIYKNATGINEGLSTEDFIKKQNIKVYPNPAKNQITVSFEDMPLQNFEIEITNLLGKKVFAQKYSITDTIEINSEILSSGIYFLTVKNQRQKETKKIVIN